MAFSDYLEDLVLEHVLNGVDLPSWPSVWLGLLTGDPLDDGTGVAANEVSVGGYARTQLTGAFTVGGTVTRGSNTAAIDAGTASGAAWGTISHVALFDAATLGNLLIHGALQTDRQIDDGDKFEFIADALGLTVS
jgi:hypothetical protein